MNLIINKLYQLKSGDELSHEDCQKIHAELSIMKLHDIPKDQRENIADYLTCALNCQSIQPEFVSELDMLLQNLQEQ